MPEKEFDLYLSLLSRFLRLNSAQRDDIADELRDHLEERLEQLAAQGFTRDEAIRAALDEFGDAAELANHFTRVAHIQRRKLIMRYTFGSVAALAASFLVATAFWPESPQAPALQKVVAQGFGTGPGAKPAATHKPAGKSVATEDEGKAAVEAKLGERIGKIEFAEIPLSEALEFLSDKTEIDILVNRSALLDADIDINSPVQLQIKRTNLTARMVLDLVLEPVGLGYTIRDGLIMVTTNAQANQIQVYNVRDLLRDAPGMGGMGMGGGMMGGGGGGFFRISPHAAGVSRETIALPSGLVTDVEPGTSTLEEVAVPGAAKVEDTQLAQGFGGGGGAAPMGVGGGGMGGGMAPGMGVQGGFMGGGGIRQSHSLAQVIATTIDPDSWDDNGGNGSIVQYHELLVVKNSQAVHGKIKALLEMMRVSARELPEDDGEEAGPGGASAAPAGGKPDAPPSPKKQP